MKQTLPIVAALPLVPAAALHAADVAHARLDEKQRAWTSLFVPELGKLFVAVPQQKEKRHDAEVPFINRTIEMSLTALLLPPQLRAIM
jgi:hypothetical protein